MELKLRVLVWHGAKIVMGPIQRPRNASNSAKTESVQSAVTRKTVQTHAWRPKRGSSAEVRRKAAAAEEELEEDVGRVQQGRQWRRGCEAGGRHVCEGGGHGEENGTMAA
jgi:hypothetical protein